MGRHGGGAFSGKDPTKVDRSAAYAARYVAKNIVAAGLASRVEVQLAYAIGVAYPVSVLVDSFGTGIIPDEKIADLVAKNFDLRPAAIIEDLNLRRPIYRKTASYGHFGRNDSDFIGYKLILSSTYLDWFSCNSTSYGVSIGGPFFFVMMETFGRIEALPFAGSTLATSPVLSRTIES